MCIINIETNDIKFKVEKEFVTMQPFGIKQKGLEVRYLIAVYD